jgi:hypothetical protein
METEQMMACLLAEIRTSQEHMKDLLARMEAKVDGREKEMKASWVPSLPGSMPTEKK